MRVLKLLGIIALVLLASGVIIWLLESIPYRYDHTAQGTVSGTEASRRLRKDTAEPETAVEPEVQRALTLREEAAQQSSQGGFVGSDETANEITGSHPSAEEGPVESGESQGGGGSSSANSLSPHFEVEPIGDDKFVLLGKSVLYNTVLDLPLREAETGKSGSKWTEWEKEFYNLVGDIYEVVLKFDRVGEPVTERAPDHYSVSIRFDELRTMAARMAVATKDGVVRKSQAGNSLLVRHNLPKRKSEEGGLRIAVFDDAVQKIFLPGRNGTGNLLLVPEVRARERGIVVCPRDFDYWKYQGGVRVMNPTPYVLVGAKVVVKALAQSGVLSRDDPAFVSASVQTTPNVPRGESVLVEKWGPRPHVSLKYRTLSSATVPIIDAREKFTVGVKLQTLHHNSLGHKTVTSGTVVVSVDKVVIRRTQTVDFKGKRFRVKPGDCYGLLKEEFVSYQFLEETLQPPAAQSGK